MYNAHTDRLELCLEPAAGHVAVEPGIEEKVLGSSSTARVPPSPATANVSNIVAEAVATGSSGILVNRPMNTSAIPFTGHGHSLGGGAANRPSSSSHPPHHLPPAAADARMPTDLPNRPPRARKLSDPSTVEVIQEDEEAELRAEAEVMEASPSPTPAAASTKRLGPGFSVVQRPPPQSPLSSSITSSSSSASGSSPFVASPSPSSSSSVQQAMKLLMSHIESISEEDEEGEEEEEGNNAVSEQGRMIREDLEKLVEEVTEVNAV